MHWCNLEDRIPLCPAHRIVHSYISWFCICFNLALFSFSMASAQRFIVPSRLLVMQLGNTWLQKQAFTGISFHHSRNIMWNTYQFHQFSKSATSSLSLGSFKKSKTLLQKCSESIIVSDLQNTNDDDSTKWSQLDVQPQDYNVSIILYALVQLHRLGMLG